MQLHLGNGVSEMNYRKKCKVCTNNTLNRSVTDEVNICIAELKNDAYILNWSFGHESDLLDSSRRIYEDEFEEELELEWMYFHFQAIRKKVREMGF